MITDRLITTASFSPDFLQFPNAWVGHLPFAAWISQEVSPKIFVELGTHSGNSYFAFCQSFVEAGISTKCYAVDTWQGDEHAGEYTDEIFTKVNTYNQENYAKLSQLLRMTFDDASTYFADESIDLLHIDGLHTYEAVRHDFETWLPKLAPGAVVMFHDTNVRERNFGVWKLWEELQARYPNNVEFVHSHGLGVLQLNNVPDGKKLDWLQPNSPEKQSLVSYFTSLGSRQLERFELNELKQQAVSLNQAMLDRDGQIVTLSQSVYDKEVQIGNLNSIIANRDALIDAIYSSTSWQIFKPLRFIAHQARRAKRVAELVPQAIMRSGGFKNTLKKVTRLYQYEGMAGLKRGFKFVAMTSQITPSVGSGAFDRNDYVEWVRRYDTLTDEARTIMRSRIKLFKNRPTISVVMPTYNAPIHWLTEAIESVRNQIYPHWELCIADDASTDQAVRTVLERYAKEDVRIKVVFREQNGHISAASNSALTLVSGQWVALLDHDDLLTEHALFWVADAINQNPEAGLIYSDEDKLDAKGQRFAPYFKCELNLELLLAQNMISHLSVYRSDLLKTLNGFRLGFEGAQDYDLVLRAVEQLNPQQVVHIPRVLYHWRAIPGSTALAADEKNYAADTGRLAVAEHLKRRGLAAVVTAAPEAPQFNRVRFVLPDPLPLVSVIIPTRDLVDLLSTCIESIFRLTTYPAFEIIIIDNGSSETATADFFASLPADRVKVVRDNSPFNFSALNNRGAKVARGDLLCLMNNDIEIITPDWLEEMVSFAVQSEIGCVGARLWYPDGRLQHGGVIVGLGGVAGHSHKYALKGLSGYFKRSVLHQSLCAVTAACIVVRRSCFEAVNGLDENFAVAFNDVDFCLRIKEAGYRNVWTPCAEMIHHESVSRGQNDTPDKQALFASEVQKMKGRWGEKLLVDPAYSPNLTLDYEDFSLAWPPRV